MELHIGKVVLGDRGDYRLEIKAKDVCDSCSFNVDVEGALAGALAGAQAGPGELAGVGGSRQLGWMQVWRWGNLLEERVQTQ